MKSDLVAINKLFVGGWWKNNLGYESINLISDDKGDNYVYLMPYGDYANKHMGKIKAVIFVKGLNAHELEVLGYATELSDDNIELPENYQRVKKQKNETNENFIKRFLDRDSTKQYKEKQDKYVENISYGGQNIKKIFSNNEQEAISYYVTFKAKKVYEPKISIILTDRDTKKINNKNTDKLYFSVSSAFSTELRFYVLYDNIKNLLDNEELWSERKKQINDIDKFEKAENFFTITSTEDDENIISNILAYYFRKYKSLYELLIKKLLEKSEEQNKLMQKKNLENISLDSEKKIIREKEFIDIFIEDENNVFIIENKIKSRINGLSKKDEKLPQEVLNKQIASQLSKYLANVKKEYPDKKRIPVIFMPNHNKIDLNNYIKGNEYIEILYSDLYDIFDEDINAKEDVYYKDFMYLLARHKEENLKELVYKDLYSRFRARIDELNNKENKK